MTSLSMKLALSSGSTFAWLKVGEYFHNYEVFSDMYIFLLTTILFLLSLLMTFKFYKDIKKLKSEIAREKYFHAAQSGDISKLRRLIISNPVEASHYVKIKTT